MTFGSSCVKCLSESYPKIKAMSHGKLSNLMNVFGVTCVKFNSLNTIFVFKQTGY